MKHLGDDELLKMLGNAMTDRISKEVQTDEGIVRAARSGDSAGGSQKEPHQELLAELNPDQAALYEAVISDEGPEQDERQVRRALRALDEREGESDDPKSDDIVDLAERRSRATQFSRRTIVGGLLAVAAAAAAIMLIPRTPQAPWPEYSMEVVTGAKTHRASGSIQDDEIHRFRSGSIFEIQLVPSEPMTETVDARCFLETPAGLKPVSLPTKISGSGAVLLRGVIDRELTISEGEHTLWVAIGRKNALPSVEELLRETRRTDRESRTTWGTLLKTRIEVEGGSGDQ